LALDFDRRQAESANWTTELLNFAWRGAVPATMGEKFGDRPLLLQHSLQSRQAVVAHSGGRYMNRKQEQPWGVSALLVILGLVAVISLNAFIVINPGEAGVLSILGKAQDGVLLEGIHFKPPLIGKVDVYDLTVQKFEVPAQSSTKDLQDLTASFAINFRLDPMQMVEIRRKQGNLQNIVSKIIAPQTQESFKVAAARRTVEEAITKREELKQDFDLALGDRLQKYGIIVLDTSVVDLTFSPEFSKAVEEKQIAEQRAQRAVYVAREAEQEAEANVNRARGQAEAQRLLRETLTPELLQKQAIDKWNGEFPQVMGGSGALPFINLDAAKLSAPARS
jgi:regulator of protease activity HflC (stomatin/prohibitin superfamily)